MQMKNILIIGGSSGVGEAITKKVALQNNVIATYKNNFKDNTENIEYREFDVIKNNIYEGGVIAPGVKLSIINLYNSTALLPLIKLKNIKKSFGKNTKDALNAGFMWGYEGLINNIINKIVKTNKLNFKIILTGGYADFFKNSIKKKVLIDQNITIKGITKIYKKFL